MPDANVTPNPARRVAPGDRRSGPDGLRARGLRRLFALLGCLCFGLGVLGVAIPLLPTTPFMLLAAACFARGSERLHAWLLGTRLFGPSLRSWYATRTVPMRAKLSAVALLVVTMSVTIVLLVPPGWGIGLRIVLVAIGVIVTVCVLRIPTRRRTPAAAPASPETAPTS